MGVYTDFAKQLMDDMHEAFNILLAQNEHLQIERDALVEDIQMLGRMGANICPLCMNYYHGEGSRQCVSCPKMYNFTWRGVVTKED